MTEWNPLHVLARLLPASRDPYQGADKAPAAAQGATKAPQADEVGELSPDAILALPDVSTVVPVAPVAEHTLGGVVKLGVAADGQTLTVVTPASTLIYSAPIPEPATRTQVIVNIPKARPIDAAPLITAQPLSTFSTAVDLVKEAERAAAESRVEDSDPFTDAAVAHRVGTNARWVLSEPAEQGEIDFGRAAWGFQAAQEGFGSPGPIALNYKDAEDFIRNCVPVRSDRDEDGYTISEEITDATGPSPRGSTFFRDALQCKRRMAWRYIFGLVPKVDAPWLTAGTVIHRALAYYWANQMDTPPSWHNPDLYALEAELAKLAPTNPDLVRDALTIMFEYERYYATGGYFQASDRRRRVRQDREWKPFSVEEIYSITIDELDPPNLIDKQVELGLRQPPTAREMAVGKAIVTIRPDIVVSPIARPERLVLVDHKTEGDDWTGSYKKTRLKVWEGDDKYSTHFQFFVYLHVLAKLFGEDRVQRQPVVQRVRRTAPFQMHRHEVLSDARKLYDATPGILRKGAAEAEIAKEHADTTIWLDVGSMPCYAPWPCSYISICEAPDDATAAAIISGRYFRIPVKK